MKRFLSIAAAILIIAAAMPLSVFASGSGIASIEINDFSVYENSNGYRDDTGNFIYCDFYPLYTVVMTDGREIQSDAGCVEIDGECYYLEFDITKQVNGDYWTVGNSYEVSGTLLDMSGTFYVTVEENPVKSLTIYDYSVIENTHGYTDENGAFIYDWLNPTYTVVFKDGTDITTDSIEVEYDGRTLCLDIDLHDQYSGNYWTVGNTYEVSASFLGMSDTFNVSVVESPVASIQIFDCTVIENTRGYYDETGHYIYTELNIEFNVYFKDGSSYYSDDGSVYIDGEWYYISFDNNQCEGNYWTTGKTYLLHGSFFGVSDTFFVRVIPSPAVSIQIEDVSVIENTNGFYDETGNFNYMLYPEYTVTLDDGSEVASMNGIVEIYDDFYGLECSSEQGTDGYWTAGNTYTATGSVLGVSGTFNVTVLENPIESVHIDDITVMENIDGHVNDDGSFIYYYIPSFTVVLKDGSVLASEHGQISIYGGYYNISIEGDLQTEGEYWTAGNTYELIGTVLGVSDSFAVTVTENPLISIEFIKAPQKTEYYKGEVFNLKGAVLRLNFNDGTYEDISIDFDYGAYIDYGEMFYINHMKMPCAIRGGDMFTESGNQTVEITVLNKTATVDVNVKPGVFTDITAENCNGVAPVITVTAPDNSLIRMTVLDIVLLFGNSTEDGEVMGGLFVTDKGIYFGSLYFLNNGNMRYELYTFEGEEYFSGIQSNEIVEYNWILAMLSTSMISSYWDMSEPHFDGSINSSNIDCIVKLTVSTLFSHFEEMSAITYTDTCLLINGEVLREIIFEVFASDSVDLSISEYYDEATDLYRIDYGSERDTYVYSMIPREIGYVNGEYVIKTATVSSNGKRGDTYTVKLNEDLKITFLGVVRIKGDANGDGTINGADVNYMKRALMGTYTSNKAMDVNDDGNVNGIDINLLKRYLVGSYTF